MLDELADTENIPVPEPSGDYSSILQRVTNRREGDEVHMPTPPSPAGEEGLT